MKIYTIGHSNHSIVNFIKLLNRNNITAIADVRSVPYSRNFEHFNQDSLRKSLNEECIEYVFLGNNLGARPRDRSCYAGSMASYNLIAETMNFKIGIDRLIKGSVKFHISLMCAEQDPIVCHRAILVCQHLKKGGLEIQHILKDGNLENHNHLEQRLLKLHGLDKEINNAESSDEGHDGKQLSLFDMRTYEGTKSFEPTSKFKLREELIQKAYKLQGDKIAYVEKDNKQRSKIYERTM